jgi:NDP-sugar pyrophosphorylase family protein
MGADFIGAAFYRKEFLQCITPETFSVVGAWTMALKRGLKIGVRILDSCYWRDIGTPASLAQVHFDALDGAVNLDIPDTLELDRDQKRCFPKSLSHELRKRIGEYAWVETGAVPEGCRISRSVVLEGAVLQNHAGIINRIVTRYGEVPFGS